MQFIGITFVPQHVMHKSLRICCLAVAIFLCSCTSINSEKTTQTVSIHITMPDSNRLRFSGKGAGAGMMLMSSMGPMGMAVGVAIDEGIAKEIETSLRAEGYDFEQALRQTLHAALTSECCLAAQVNLEVERYGFKTWGSAEFSDPISPELKLKVKRQGQPEYVIDYPAKFDGDLPVIPLDEAKVNGKTSKKVMQNALSLVAEHLRKVLSQRQPEADS